MRPLLRVIAPLLAAGLPASYAAAQECRPVMDPVQQPVEGAVMRMAPATYRIGDTTYTTNVYNGRFVAPTLTMRPGQRVNMAVVNAMRPTADQTAADVASTNYHYHGLVVSPSPDSADNVTHVAIAAGAPPRRFHFPVPSYHTEGMFWYHPHPHGLTGSQVAGGLSGALMIGSILKYFPQYRGVRERTLLIRDMSFSFASRTVLNINGSTCALLPVAPGEQQLWHIGNFSANHFVNLKLRGMQWTLLALDGNPLARAETVDSLYIPPGSRAEVIVTGPAAGTRAELYTDTIFPNAPRVTLGYLVGTSSRSARRVSRPAPAGRDEAVLDTLRFLTEAVNVNRHTFRYQFIGDSAGVNDSIYAPNHPPVSMPWGQVQEWTIVNETQFLHTFHIHQTDFAVMTVNGRPANEGRLRDNIPIGVHKDASGNTVGDTVVIRFVFEPIAAGPFVFHCHVLQHEDEGMMHNVCVYDPRDPNGRQKCNAMFTSAAGHASH
ncbi:MAG TPA: multicopper oxidase family protein [Longimicrobium sp.]|jgi:FtsP/CotA-like multicopper oxidase with cupredoxin domain